MLHGTDEKVGQALADDIQQLYRDQPDELLVALNTAVCSRWTRRSGFAYARASSDLTRRSLQETFVEALLVTCQGKTVCLREDLSDIHKQFWPPVDEQDIIMAGKQWICLLAA